MSCTRGVLKEVVGLYKSYLRSACPSGDSAKPVEPFICMNIICRAGSYDANVEPAKDDVLFMDSEGFLVTVEQFFRNVYGELRPKDDSRKTAKHAASRPRGFEILLARKPQATKDSELPAQVGEDENVCEEQRNAFQAPQSFSPNPVTALASDVQLNAGILSDRAEFQRQASQEKDELSGHAPSLVSEMESNEQSGNVQHNSNQKQMWQHNMYSDDYERDDDLYGFGDSQQGSLASEDANEEENLRDVNISNPWTIAKLNAPIRTRPSDREPSQCLSSNGQLLTPERQRGDISSHLNTISRDRLQDTTAAAPGLPTPGRPQHIPSAIKSSISAPSHLFPFPMKAWGKGDRTTTSRINQNLEGRRHSAGALEAWVQKSIAHDPTTLERLDSPRECGPVEQDMLSGSPTRDFVSASTLQMGTPLSAIPDVSQKPNRRPAPRKLQQNINKPFVSPVNESHRVWFETEPPRRTRPAQPAVAQNTREALAATAPIHYGSEHEVPIIERRATSTARLSAKPMHPDLAVTMDYEMRKQAAMQKRKDFLRQQALDARLRNQIPTDEVENVLPPTNSPHKNRYIAAVASLSSAGHTATTTTGTTSALEDSDPRAYLLRVQQREEADRQSGVVGSTSRLKRRKTTMLPLETTPAQATVQDLVLVIERPIGTIEGEVTAMSACDEYVRAGKIGEGFASLDIEDVRAWEGKVRKLVEERYRPEVGEKVSLEIDLWSAVQDLVGMGVATGG